MSNVKVFADEQMDKQWGGKTDKLTGQKLYAPDLSMWAHKETFSMKMRDRS